MSERCRGPWPGWGRPGWGRPGGPCGSPTSSVACCAETAVLGRATCGPQPGARRGVPLWCMKLLPPHTALMAPKAIKQLRKNDGGRGNEPRRKLTRTRGAPRLSADKEGWLPHKTKHLNSPLYNNYSIFCASSPAPAQAGPAWHQRATGRSWAVEGKGGGEVWRRQGPLDGGGAAGQKASRAVRAGGTWGPVTLTSSFDR